MEKNEIRKIIKEKRNKFPSFLRKIMSVKAQNNIIHSQLFHASDILLLYFATGSEVEMDRVIKKALRSGKKVYLPLTNRVNTVDRNSQNNEMEFHRLYTLEELRIGNYGIYEPSKENEIYIQSEGDKAIIFVPGVVFDRNGNRYGYGKGYYDRYLSDMNIEKVGVCYEMQLLHKIPSDEYDIKMDYLVTEKELWKI